LPLSFPEVDSDGLSIGLRPKYPRRLDRDPPDVDGAPFQISCGRFPPVFPPIRPSLRAPGAFGVASHLASVAGQAMNRYRGTQAEFQFSIVAPHTAHSKLLISRASTMCSLRRTYRIDDRLGGLSFVFPGYALTVLMLSNPLKRVIFRNKALDYFRFAIGP
jgi:hypothetical protein